MSWVMQEILKPISRRVGTSLGTALVSLGVPSGEIDVITAGAFAALGVLIDLGASHYNRKASR